MERQIKGIFIPIEIWQAADLCWNEKILLMEIDSFTSKGLDCYFSNEYIAHELLGCSVDTASRLVGQLINKGYIRQTRFDGRKRYVESRLVFGLPDGGQTMEKCRGRLVENADSDSVQMPRQTRQNSVGFIYNKPINKTSNKIFRAPSLQEVEDYCKERKNGIDAMLFVTYYESIGWMVGKSPMKDWKAAVRTWEKRHAEDAKRRRSQGSAMSAAPTAAQVCPNPQEFYADGRLRDAAYWEEQARLAEELMKEDKK